LIKDISIGADGSYYTSRCARKGKDRVLSEKHLTFSLYILLYDSPAVGAIIRRHDEHEHTTNITTNIRGKEREVSCCLSFFIDMTEQKSHLEQKENGGNKFKPGIINEKPGGVSSRPE